LVIRKAEKSLIPFSSKGSGSNFIYENCLFLAVDRDRPQQPVCRVRASPAHRHLVGTQARKSPVETAILMNEQATYHKIGGDAGVARLCDRFYALMETVPQFAELRAMHPDDLQGSRDKLYMFLSGWFGGPDLFVEKFGHPRLRARHMPFAIGVKERDQWVACMVLAMEDVGIEEPVRAKLLRNFFNTADFIRNREG